LKENKKALYSKQPDDLRRWNRDHLRKSMLSFQIRIWVAQLFFMIIMICTGGQAIVKNSLLNNI